MSFTPGAAVILLGLAARSWASDGVEPIGVSMRANARGGADVAVGDTALSQIENPASLAYFRRQRFDFGAQLAFPIATWHGPLETADSHNHFIPLADMAVALPLDEFWTGGLAVHSRAGLGTEYEMRHLLIPLVDRDVGGEMKCVDVEANLARRVTDALAVGGGVRFGVAQTRFSTVLGPADVDFGRGHAFTGGFQVGAMFKPREDLALGVGYRSPSWGTDLAGGSATATLLGVAPIPLGDVAIRDFRLPQRIAAGVAWDASPRLKLVGEARWLNYADSTLNKAGLQTDGWVDLRYPLPLGYRDQWAFMAGAEYRLDEHWVLAAGYHYATRPVEPGNLLPMGSTISQHHVTAGVRYERDHWWIGAGYCLAPATHLRGAGWSRIPLGLDYGFSELEQTQHVLGLGFGIEW